MPTKKLPSHPQVVTRYGDAELPLVLEACERMEAHLTAAGLPASVGPKVSNASCSLFASK